MPYALDEEFYPEVPRLHGVPDHSQDMAWVPNEEWRDYSGFSGPGTPRSYGGGSGGGYGPSPRSGPQYVPDHAKMNAASLYRSPVRKYDPAAEPEMVPFIVPHGLDSYASRAAAPWAPYNISIPSYGRFIHPLGRKNLPAPYGTNPRPFSEFRKGTKVDEANRYKPKKRYTCDGKTVKDEAGDLMAILRRYPRVVDLHSPNGTPWMRYDENTRAVTNIDSTNPMPGDRRLAVYSREEPVVLNGNPAAQEDPAQPSLLYEYAVRWNYGERMLVYVYDAMTHEQVALMGRPRASPYPSMMVINKGVPNHLLLIALFLV